MLGDRQPRRRRDEGDRGRQIDRPRAVAARPAGVGEQIIGPFERRIGGAQRAGGADQFVLALAFELERDQHRGDRAVVEPAFDQRFEQRLSFGLRERFAGEEPGQSVEGRVGDGSLGGDLGGGQIGHIHG